MKNRLTIKEYLKLDPQKDKDKIIEFNKAITEEYPFLIPRNHYTWEPSEKYDYSCTMLDGVPEGWLIAFGEEFLKELKNEVVREDLLDKFFILDWKEKFGVQTIYTSVHSEEIADILFKYEDLSSRVCQNCGKPAEVMTSGWIGYWCKDCLEEAEYFGKTIPIDECE